MADFKIDPDYVEVPERMREFFGKYPDGCLQTVEIRAMTFGDLDFLVYIAAAYREPDDPRPGHGSAWEPVPGKTPYTKDSELMNAETSAWGRAIMAIGASESKKVASAEEVRNREYTNATQPSQSNGRITEGQGKAIYAICRSQGRDQYEACSEILSMDVTDTRQLSKSQASLVIDTLNGKR